VTSIEHALTDDQEGKSRENAMFRFVCAVLGMLLGFVIGAVACSALISLFSGNTHDKGVEMAMTAAFVGGPIGAILGLVAGLLWRPRQPHP
jgi:hypothetical protein